MAEKTLTKREAIKKGKEYLAKIRKLEEQIKHYWLLIAELAYKVCDHDGSTNPNAYTYKKFAEDIGGCKYTLSNYVKFYRNAYMKAKITDRGKKDPAELTRKERGAIFRAGRHFKKDASEKEVDDFIKSYISLTQEDKRIIKFNEKLEAYRLFLQSTDLTKADNDWLEITEMHCKKIMDEIKIIRKLKETKKPIIKKKWVKLEEYPSYELNPGTKEVRNSKTKSIKKQDKMGQVYLYNEDTKRTEKVGLTGLIKQYVEEEKKEILKKT